MDTANQIKAPFVSQDIRYLQPQLNISVICHSIQGQNTGLLVILFLRQLHPQPNHALLGQGTEGRQPLAQHMDPPSRSQGQPDHSSECPDAIIPSLKTLRGNPVISEAVKNLVASYKGTF